MLKGGKINFPPRKKRRAEPEEISSDEDNEQNPDEPGTSEKKDSVTWKSLENEYAVQKARRDLDKTKFHFDGGIEGKFVNGKYTGDVRCLDPRCKAKKKEFICQDTKSRQPINLKKHAKSSPNYKFRETKTGSNQKSDKEKLTEMEATIICKEHLPLTFFAKESLKAYRAQLLSSVNVDPQCLDQLHSSSYHYIKEDMKKQQEILRTVLKKELPTLLEQGFCALQADHKYIKSRTHEDKKNGMAVLVTVSCEEIFSSLILDFRATDSTSYESTKNDFEEILDEYGLLPLWRSKMVALVGDSKFAKFEDDSDFMVVCLLHTINRIVDSMEEKAYIFGIYKERFKAVDNFISAIAKLRKPLESSSEDCPRTVNAYLKKLSEQGVPAIDKKKILKGRMRYPEKKLTDAEIKEDSSVKKFPKFRDHYHSIRFGAKAEKFATLSANMRQIVSLKLNPPLGYSHLLHQVSLPEIQFIEANHFLLKEMMYYFCADLSKLTIQIGCAESGDIRKADYLPCWRKNAALDHGQERAEIVDKLAKTALQKTLRLIFGKSYLPAHKKISKDGKETFVEAEIKTLHQAEPPRISKPQITSLFLYWPNRRVDLYRACEAIKTRDNEDFFYQNKLILEEAVTDWQIIARNEIHQLAQKLQLGEEPATASQVTRAVANLDVYDPRDAVAQTEPARRSEMSLWEKVEKEINEYFNDGDHWRAWLSAQNVDSPNSESVLFELFWRDQKSKWPILSAIAQKYANMPVTSAEIERNFSTMSYDLESGRSSQKAQHTGMVNQRANAGPFEEAIKEIKKKQNKN
ncbi:Oidioi.mRNA.OKI2018_I69.chr1.g264.t1.cds [Oikopleura dioica]|uniref:Oidioi.mRNA.OKI2018_I69.chr1.g264.t1.cds n=1 Tax=Oikopleura dioica TaxID=34765 RepID=A0ABN7SJA7_OIKDI|nr:Oidioi.mRNA.OKI2018_I69.chr1.g264.t1.cds [Oikopleura dioica]